MSTTRPRSASNRRLALFLAAAIVPPVALFLGPFRKYSFPPDVETVRAVARVAELRPDGERIRAWLADAALDAADVEPIARAFEDGRFGDAALALERVAPDHATSGVRLLFGIAELLDQRPAAALPGLQDAAGSPRPELRSEGQFALGQALLLLGRTDDAERRLAELVSASGGPRRDLAARQLSELRALR